MFVWRFYIKTDFNEITINSDIHLKPVNKRKLKLIIIIL